MTTYAHFPGSLPFANTEESFRWIGSTLGERARLVPDGETGEQRKGWLPHVPWFEANPTLERLPDLEMFAANVVLDHVTDPALLQAVTDKGERLREALADLPGVSTTRGRGLMVAAELEAVRAPELVQTLLTEHRLIANATGPSTLRLLPPLIVSAAEIDDAVGRIGAALATAR